MQWGPSIYVWGWCVTLGIWGWCVQCICSVLINLDSDHITILLYERSHHSSDSIGSSTLPTHIYANWRRSSSPQGGYGDQRFRLQSDGFLVHPCWVLTRLPAITRMTTSSCARECIWKVRVNKDGGEFPKKKSWWLISVAELISSIIVAELPVRCTK